jgi:hypothetical protein
MSKTKKQLAIEYNISRATLSRWLKKLDLQFKNKKILTSLEVKQIYDKLGEP